MLLADGTLYYRKSGRTQKVVVWKSERNAVLVKAHLSSEEGSGSHVDSEAMLAAIEPRYKWSNMNLDIDDWVHVLWISSSSSSSSRFVFYVLIVKNTF